MSEAFRNGRRVRWNRGTGIGRGKIIERFDRHIARTLEGAKVSRNRGMQNPAYLISSDNGGQALKLGSEIIPA